MKSSATNPNEPFREPAHDKQWRTLEEFAAQTNACELIESIAPAEDASEMVSAMDRRNFLQLAAASFALAGLTGCTRQPTEKILPYVNTPENVIPGHPKYYATAVPSPYKAQGVLVESHMGRPTKVEGNPDHPASLGASSVHAQASVLDLYDPDRATSVTHRGQAESWDDFILKLREPLQPIRAKQGTGLRILTGSVLSPTLGAQLRAVLKDLPNAEWHQYEAAGEHAHRAGSVLAFGRPVNTFYDFSKAKVVLSLDADFLACGDESTRYAHDYINRRVQNEHLDPNRLYVVESTMTATGGKADHRLPLRYAEVEAFATKVAAAVGVAGLPTIGATQHDKWIDVVARELSANRGASIVLAGHHQSPAVHALAHAINHALGNAGTTVLYTDPLEVESVDQVASLRKLVSDMEAGAVDVLLILGGNPVYDAPADFEFGKHLSKVKFAVYSGLHHNETAARCQWSLPDSHFLETWGDTRAFDGTLTIQQPLIQPLYDSRSSIEVLDLLLTSGIARPAHDIVRTYWQQQSGASDFEQWWRTSLRNGTVANSALPQITPAMATQIAQQGSVSAANGLEIVFRPDPYLHDGRYANNAWLQELPQPMTKLTWDNAIYISPATAAQLKIEPQDHAALSFSGRTLTGGVWVLPGHPDSSVTVHLGWGRQQSGRAGNGAGFSAYPLRLSTHMSMGTGAQLRKLGDKLPLASTQMHQTMEGRDLVMHSTVDGYKHKPEFVKEKSKEPPQNLTLYPQWQYKGNAWGMAIDLTRCVNCNACVTACQAENNIPVVGKQQVLARRAMHWLRIDTYYEGDPANPRAYYQPVPCMQCEDAPCEAVCPVQATVHSDDGLNDMVYNRCVGTRYCSNNCPYKVRRFNFLLYQDWSTESIRLQRNPDVTVRSRGVMEKCTYCVQRIREAEIKSQVANQPIRDGDLQTACQQSCPTQAIVFGDINQADSEVAKRKAGKLNYALLAELNTRPRTTYLAELRNPNPELEESEG